VLFRSPKNPKTPKPLIDRKKKKNNQETHINNLDIYQKFLSMQRLPSHSKKFFTFEQQIFDEEFKRACEEYFESVFEDIHQRNPKEVAANHTDKATLVQVRVFRFLIDLPLVFKSALLACRSGLQAHEARRRWPGIVGELCAGYEHGLHSPHLATAKVRV